MSPKQIRGLKARSIIGGGLGLSVHHTSRFRFVSAKSVRIWVMAISLSLIKRSGAGSPWRISVGQESEEAEPYRRQ